MPTRGKNALSLELLWWILINTNKQETFGDNNETPPTVERLTDHVTFMPRLKHRFIGSSYFIFTPKLFYSCLKKRN